MGDPRRRFDIKKHKHNWRLSDKRQWRLGPSGTNWRLTYTCRHCPANRFEYEK